MFHGRAFRFGFVANLAILIAASALLIVSLGSFLRSFDCTVFAGKKHNIRFGVRNCVVALLISWVPRGYSTRDDLESQILTDHIEFFRGIDLRPSSFVVPALESTVTLRINSLAAHKVFFMQVSGLLLAIPFICASLIWTWFVFRERSRRRRENCCFACGYCLNGIESLRCPECGSPTRITVIPPEPKRL